MHSEESSARHEIKIVKNYHWNHYMVTRIVHLLLCPESQFWKPFNMGQTNVTPIVNIPPFGATEIENFGEFELHSLSSIGVTGIQHADRHLDLHLYLKGGARAYYDQLPRSTRQDYDAGIASLRQRCESSMSRVTAYCLQSTEIQTMMRNSSWFSPRHPTHCSTTISRRWSIQQAANGKPAAAAEKCQLERTRRVREVWINGLLNNMKRFLSNQPDTHNSSKRTLWKSGQTPCWTTLSWK